MDDLRLGKDMSNTPNSEEFVLNGIIMVEND